MIKSLTQKLEAKYDQMLSQKQHREQLEASAAQDKILNDIVSGLAKVSDDIKSIPKVDIPPQPDSIKVNNLDVIKIPEIKSVDINKPKWLTKQFTLSELIESLGLLFDKLFTRKFKIDLDEYRSANKSIAVRLSNGKNFIESLGGSIGAAFPSTIETVETETVPTANNKLNPQLELSYTDGNLTSITKTINGIDYTKTLSYTDGNLTEVSPWSTDA